MSIIQQTYYQIYHAANKERLSKQAAERYLKRRDAVLAKSAKWAQENRDKTLLAKKKYKKTARGKISEKRYKRARRAAHRLARPAWRDQEKIDAIYQEAEANGKHVDHIVPLRHELVCGLHVETNLQIIDPLENHRKGNRWWPDMPDTVKPKRA